MSQKEFVKPVGLETPYRLFNLGGTAFVESKQGDDLDIMPASWNCQLDYDKMTVVIDSTHYSRKLIEASEYILLAVPGMGIQKEILYLGSVSKNDNPNKIADSGLKFFTLPDCDFPLPEGCSAWAVIKLIREPHNKRRMTSSWGKSLRLGLTPVSSPTTIGIWKKVRMNCALCTMLPAATSMPSANEWMSHSNFSKH